MRSRATRSLFVTALLSNSTGLVEDVVEDVIEEAAVIIVTLSNSTGLVGDVVDEAALVIISLSHATGLVGDVVDEAIVLLDGALGSLFGRGRTPVYALGGLALRSQ